MTRQPELDALRGLMLVLITVTHVPTTSADRLSQPFGFVSAAEGFVFLSAFLVGGVYTKIACGKGPSAMRRGLWDRAGIVWAWHAAMLLFLFTGIAALGIAPIKRRCKKGSSSAHAGCALAKPSIVGCQFGSRTSFVELIQHTFGS